MTVMSNEDLKDKKVLTADGTELGEVEVVHVDTATWHVVTIGVKIRRDMLERLNLERPMFGSQVVQISIDQVAGVSDALILKAAAKDISFIGGKAPAPAES